MVSCSRLWTRNFANQDRNPGLRRPVTGEMNVARIAGVNIPTNKRVLIALQYIHGIGPKSAEEIVKKVSIPEERRVSQLTHHESLQIPQMIRPHHILQH